MRPSASIRLVAGREISERVGSRPMRISTVVLALLVVAGVVIPALVQDPRGSTKIGVVGPRAQALTPYLRLTARAAKIEISVVNVATAAGARKMVDSGSLDAALRVGPHLATVTVARGISPMTRALLESSLYEKHQQQVLIRAGVSAATLASALKPVALKTDVSRPVTPRRAARTTAALIVGLLLYFVMTTYGNAVAIGVAHEKTSRTAEVLLGAVRPRELCTGKVAGIGLCGLGQLMIVVGAGLAANAFAHTLKLPSTVWLLAPGGLLWFALGYAFYSFGFATAGAMVARQEDVQFVTLPIGFLLLVGFLLVHLVTAASHETWIRVLSILPPFAPSLMPARIALNAVAWWEVLLALLIMLVAIDSLIRLTSRVYAFALIRGNGLTWRAVLGSLKQQSVTSEKRIRNHSYQIIIQGKAGNDVSN
jgi:ABC-2 type transport system permease protein